jgi:biotin operon repressor
MSQERVEGYILLKGSATVGELVDALGMSRNAVYRCLSRLKKQTKIQDVPCLQNGKLMKRWEAVR